MEKIIEKTQKETILTKFRLLAVISLIQSISLWFILYNHITYSLSLLENIAIAVVFVIFYSVVFAKKHVKTLVDKVLEW